MAKIICSFTPRTTDDGKTPWFPATTRPKRAGWYERRYWCGQLRYFDGTNWRRGSETGDVVCAPEWRGLVHNVELTGAARHEGE